MSDEQAPLAPSYVVSTVAILALSALAARTTHAPVTRTRATVVHLQDLRRR